MKVFAVFERDNSEYFYCGLYGTNEKAEQKIDEIVKEFNRDIDNFYIEETEI